MTPFHSEEERRIVALCREQLRWIDSLPERFRTIAASGVPEEDFERIARKAEETLAAIRGQTARVWHPNPRMMGPNEPVGHWTTEMKP